MASKKSVLTKSTIQKQTFSYAKDQVNLSFTLRIDNSSELKSFKECLEAAVKDIELIMKGMKN